MKHALFLLLITLCIGCATPNVAPSQLNPHMAKKDFLAGEKALERKNFQQALTLFEQVRSEFPYSDYGILSDLKIADIYFAESKWLEAAQSYRFFIQFHPRHSQASYALFQAIKSYIASLPSEWWPLPKNERKDQSLLKEALFCIHQFFERFPEHPQTGELQTLRQMLLEKLATHDMNVAYFYSQRKKWPAACMRYERAVTLYPQTLQAPVALYEWAMLLQHKLNDPKKAQALFQRLITQYPQSPYAQRAQMELKN